MNFNVIANIGIDSNNLPIDVRNGFLYNKLCDYLKQLSIHKDLFNLLLSRAVCSCLPSFLQPSGFHPCDVLQFSLSYLPKNFLPSSVFLSRTECLFSYRNEA